MTKELGPNPQYNAADPNSRPVVWIYKEADRGLQAGDYVEFLCSGRGRGNHLRVFALVTKVNRKTFKAIEQQGSYSPGTKWTVNIEYSLEDGNGGIVIDLTKRV